MPSDHGSLLYLGDGTPEYSSRLQFVTASGREIIEEHPPRSGLDIPLERTLQALDELSGEGWRLVNVWRSNTTKFDRYLLRRDTP